MKEYLIAKEETRHKNPLKYTLRLNAKSSFEDAIACAENLAKTLDLGTIPAERLSEKWRLLSKRLKMI